MEKMKKNVTSVAVALGLTFVAAFSVQAADWTRSGTVTAPVTSTQSNGSTVGSKVTASSSSYKVTGDSAAALDTLCSQWQAARSVTMSSQANEGGCSPENCKSPKVCITDKEGNSYCGEKEISLGDCEGGDPLCGL